MSDPRVEEALRALELAESHRVHRLDPGSDFTGRVAVLPSAFNPPTEAHLRLLDLALEEDDVSASSALLSTRNVDKGLYGAGLVHRVGMLLTLRRAGEDVAVLASNAARISDQARALREEHPGVGFDFIVGYDTLVRVFDPRYYDDMARELERFFAHHRLFAANRDTATVDEVRRYLESPAARDFAERIIVKELEPASARRSSTAARSAVSERGMPEGVPPEVESYIAEHGLYRDMDAPTK
ncbi:MAG: hypothetical protein U5Q44_15450 [Dehalococcoidia bacterium]|nr:hypothetical protein [Dehalococcoidia bacterium]